MNMLKKILLSIPFVVSLSYVVLTFIDPTSTIPVVSNLLIFMPFVISVLIAIIILIIDINKRYSKDEAKRNQYILLIIFFSPFALIYIWNNIK